MDIGVFFSLHPSLLGVSAGGSSRVLEARSFVVLSWKGRQEVCDSRRGGESSRVSFEVIVFVSSPSRESLAKVPAPLSRYKKKRVPISNQLSAGGKMPKERERSIETQKAILVLLLASLIPIRSESR